MIVAVELRDRDDARCANAGNATGFNKLAGLADFCKPLPTLEASVAGIPNINSINAGFHQEIFSLRRADGDFEAFGGEHFQNCTSSSQPQLEILEGSRLELERGIRPEPEKRTGIKQDLCLSISACRNPVADLKGIALQQLTTFSSL